MAVSGAFHKNFKLVWIKIPRSLLRKLIDFFLENDTPTACGEVLSFQYEIL